MAQDASHSVMSLPPFTTKSALTYLVGVAAALVTIILLAIMLMHAKPHGQLDPSGTNPGLTQ
jgi:hypothetical protein